MRRHRRLFAPLQSHLNCAEMDVDEALHKAEYLHTHLMLHNRHKPDRRMSGNIHVRGRHRRLLFVQQRSHLHRVEMEDVADSDSADTNVNVKDARADPPLANGQASGKPKGARTRLPKTEPQVSLYRILLDVEVGQLLYI